MTTDFPRQALAERLREGVALLPDVPDAAIPGLIDYLALLHRWNRAYNLSAVRDPAEMVTRHLLDSLAILPWLRGPRLLDVGSGAGLPGIPLALARPDLRVVLLDANGKKTRFLQQAVAELRLANVQVIRQRIEDMADADGFSCIVSRAFARVDVFVAGAARLLAPGGCLLAMKARFDASEEVAQLAPQLEVIDLAVPLLDEARCLVRIEAAAI